MLSTHNTAVVATVNKDGSPTATPVRYYSLGFEIFYTSWNASRNHPGWKTVDALAVNVYDVVDRPYLVVSEQALARLVEVLGA